MPRARGLVLGLMELEAHRARIWSLCYRITGVAADADELVQETFVRALESPPQDALLPWLVRIATNASRDLLRRRQTQRYAGPWLPSPIDDALITPDARYGQAESLSYAFLIALEALSPTQRSIVILRDVLGYSVEETAQVLARSEANVKTSHHRAREALTAYEHGRARREVPHELAQQAMMRFLALAAAGDFARMASLLAEDARAVNDGAGEFLAAQKIVQSRAQVLRFLESIGTGVTMLSSRALTCGGLPAVEVHIQPSRPRQAAHSLNLFEVAPSGEITTVYSLVATRKLAHFRDGRPGPSAGSPGSASSSPA